MATETEKFLYGATLLGHTVEGENYASDWWRWEQRPGRIAGGATSQTAADHWTRYEDDTKLASTLGLNCLLVSIEWSRIEPKHGEFDQDALDHYVNVLESMNKNGITPIVALQAITLPAWFAEAGGWAQKNAEDTFGEYAKETARALSPYCQHWIPLYSLFDSLKMGYLDGAWPPGRKNALALSFGVIRNTFFAMLEAWANIRRIDSDAQIGYPINAPDVQPGDEESPWDYRIARALNYFESGGTYEERGDRFSLGDAIDDDEHEETFDFIVLSMPARRWARFAPTAIRRGFVQPVDENGGDVDFHYRQPDAARLSAIIQHINTEDKPILFVGGAHDFAEDNDRCAYLLDHIEAIHDLKKSGVNVLGYVHQSYLDGFEWDRGYSTRRGLVHVDWETFARTPNKSAYLLGDIAGQGEISPSAIRKYCPDWQSKLEAAL
jgi:beta-glucosidase